MSQPAYYQTIAQQAEAEFKDRGSRFIAYAFPMDHPDQFKQQLAALKKTHPKAVHHCFAYRLGLDGTAFRSGDDGEPSGSAGKPILGQIDSKKLTNVGVIVVRYFGGSLLGVPGLIHAYKTATALALQLVPTVQKNVEHTYLVQYDYTNQNEVMMVVKQTQCTVLAQEAQLFCLLTLGIPVGRKEEALHRLQEIRGVSISP